jgi:hypothetical protein
LRSSVAKKSKACFIASLLAAMRSKAGMQEAKQACSSALSPLLHFLLRTPSASEAKKARSKEGGFAFLLRKPCFASPDCCARRRATLASLLAAHSDKKKAASLI